MAVLHFKLQNDTAPEEKEVLLRDELNTPDITEVKPLFPGHRSANLARLFSVETPDKISARRVLKILRKNPTVEYAEEAAERTTI